LHGGSTGLTTDTKIAVMMKTIISVACRWWAGAALFTGLMAAPALFSADIDLAMAGEMAGRLFWVVNVFGVIVLTAGVLWLLWHRAWRIVPGMQICTGLAWALVVVELAVMHPWVQFAKDFHGADSSCFTWVHGFSELVYLAICLLALWMLSWQRFPPEIRADEPST